MHNHFHFFLFRHPIGRNVLILLLLRSDVGTLWSGVQQATRLTTWTRGCVCCTCIFITHFFWGGPRSTAVVCTHSPARSGGGRWSAGGSGSRPRWGWRPEAADRDSVTPCDTMKHTQDMQMTGLRVNLSQRLRLSARMDTSVVTLQTGRRCCDELWIKRKKSNQTEGAAIKMKN